MQRKCSQRERKREGLRRGAVKYGAVRDADNIPDAWKGGMYVMSRPLRSVS